MASIIASMLKRLLNIGCPPSWVTGITATNGPRTCCDDCTNAPSAYAILSACNYRMYRGDSKGEMILPRGCLILMKDCIRGCDYSSRWIMDLPTTNGTRFQQLQTDHPILQSDGGNNLQADCIHGCPELDSEGMPIEPYVAREWDFTRWNWGTTIDSIDPETGVIVETTGRCDGGLATQLVLAKWWTKRSAQFFILNCETRDGYTAIWSADTNTCTDYVTVTWVSGHAELENLLPRKLCIVPIESQPPLCCDDATSQCNCDDIGIAACNDCDGPYTVNVTASGGCTDFTFSGPRTVSRRQSDDPMFSNGVAFPGSAPCGVFTFSIPLGECANDVLVVFWCDGTSYTGKAYCYDADLAEYVLQGDLTLSVELACAGPVIEFTLPTLACCCPDNPIVTVCGGCDTLETLTIDITSGDCAEFNTSFSLVWDSGISQHVGTVTICGQEWQFTMSCGGEEISYTFAPTEACGGGSSGGLSLAGCDPYEVTGTSLEVTLCGDSITCCGAGPVYIDVSIMEPA